MKKLIEKISGVPFIAMALSVLLLFIADCVLNFSVPLLFFYAMFMGGMLMMMTYSVSDLRMAAMLMMPLIVYEAVFMSVASSVGELLSAQLYPWGWIALRGAVLAAVMGVQTYMAAQMARYFSKDMLCTIAVTATAAVMALMVWRFPSVITLPVIAASVAIAICRKSFSPPLDEYDTSKPSIPDVGESTEKEMIIGKFDESTTTPSLPEIKGENLSGSLLEHERKARLCGDADSMMFIADCYWDGNCGVEPNDNMAFLWTLAAAKAGHPRAQFNVGVFNYQLWKGERGDTPFMPNYIYESAHWHTLAAAQNHPKACYMLASYYERGFGVGVDFDKAMELYRKALSLGIEAAQRNIDQLNRRPKADTIERWKASAAKGDAEAQFRLASEGYLEGNGGLPHDMAEALEWLWKAKMQSHKEATEMVERLVHNYKNAKEMFSHADLEAMAGFIDKHGL